MDVEERNMDFAERCVQEFRLREVAEKQRDDTWIAGAHAQVVTEIIKERFGVTPDSVNGRSAVVGGITINCAYICAGIDDWVLSIQGTCPNCLYTRSSENIYSLADLGRQLVDFKPSYHTCMGPGGTDINPKAQLSPPSEGRRYKRDYNRTSELLYSNGWVRVSDIESQRNVETRRVMLKHYGEERYLRDSGAKLFHKDEYGELYRKHIKGDEPLAMVHIINSTPEPDGTKKKFMLRVPPTMRTAKEAVAWTFGLTESEYNPAVET